jgi:hypothetical protein
MTDIVERLRRRIWPRPEDAEEDCKEAADEIERLRAALKAIIDQVHDYERVNNLAPNPPRLECWDSVAHARAVLEGR